MAATTPRWPGLLGGLFGLVMAIALTKFGNPIIFKSMETAPTNIWELLLATWPASWSFYVAALAACLLIATNWGRVSLIPRSLLLLLGGWFLWAALSMARSIDAGLSQLTIMHFGATALIFFLAVTCLTGPAKAQAFFKVMILALAFAMWIGIDQHNGGLEATRKAFYELPNWESFPPDYKLKITSNRIFGPFVYPNAFAGALLIWGPVLTLALWDWTQKLPSIAQKVLVGLFGWAVSACFFWTGSKAGWLIAMVMFVVALLHLKSLKRTAKVGIIAAVIVVGLAGFALKYRSYFEKGATSASARIVYWKAAVQIANAHPIFGAGPGTFAKTFAPIKPPEAEMARLVHNDYLEQACDSGWPASILFVAFVGGAMFLSHQSISRSPYHFLVWLGLLGWSLQSFVEFGLYIPAISWSAFVLLGWLLGSRIDIDTPKPAR